jgi:hypothetical protein
MATHIRLSEISLEIKTPLMKTILSILIASTVGLAGLNTPGSESQEQIVFDYFVANIIKDDFKDLSVIEFKGKTEENYSSLGDYKSCLTPERLDPILKNVTKGDAQVKDIRLTNAKEIKVIAFTNSSSAAKLFLYRSVHVADNYYVFLSLKIPKQSAVIYIFEVTPDGKISRSCKGS